jgi:hypothetical protein
MTTAQDEILTLLRMIDAKFDRLLDALMGRYEHGTPVPPLPEVPAMELEYPVTIKPVKTALEMSGYVGGTRPSRLHYGRRDARTCTRQDQSRNQDLDRRRNDGRPAGASSLALRLPYEIGRV